MESTALYPRPVFSSNLDLVRAVAVLCVFFSHLPSAFLGQPQTEIEWHFGQLGVLIFFVHTSLVLMQSIERSGESVSVVQFYIRRAFRIYPLAMFCVLVAYFFGGYTPWDLVSNLALINNLVRAPHMVGGLWTLPIELQMYLMLPLFFVALGSRRLAWTFGAWFVAVGLALIQLRLTDRLSVFSYAPCFMGGVLAWRLQRQFRPFLPGTLILAAFPLTTLVWMTATREHHYWHRWVFGIALGAVLPWFKELSESWLTKGAAVVAKYSYGVYLSHIAIMNFVPRYCGSMSALMQWVILAVLACVIPVLMFRFIEQPAIEFGKRVTRRLSSRAQQPSYSRLAA